MPIPLLINGTTYQYPVGGDTSDSNWGANATSWASEVSLLMGGGGLIHPSCRAATTANITLSGIQTIDGVVLIVGDRVLVKNQTTASQNGIYTVATGAWPYAFDANTSARVRSAMVTTVEEGALNLGKGYVLTTPNPISLGVTALTFGLLGTLPLTGGGATIAQSAGQLQYTDGGVATLDGHVFDTTTAKSSGKVAIFRSGGVNEATLDANGTLLLRSTVGSFAGNMGVTSQGAGSDFVYLRGGFSDGASAVACKISNLYGLSNATAAIVQLYQDNLATKVLEVRASGKIAFSGVTGAKVAGTSTLVSGTVTVSTTAVATGSVIMLSRNTPGGTLGIGLTAPVASIVNATSFVINSVSSAGAVVATDTSTINWWIIEAA